jgi:membrane protease YdiL (CAAX protease family)
MSSAIPPAPPFFFEHPELPEGQPPPARRTRWRPWSAWVALVAGFAGALAGAVVIGVVAAAFGASFDDPPPAVNIIATIVQDACLIGSALLFARVGGLPRPGEFGLRATRVWPALGWMAVAFFGFYAVTAAWVAILGTSPTDDQLPKELGVDSSTVALVAVAFLVAVVAPVAEEFFFRGFFFTALRNWKGLWPAAIVTGLVFGAIHAGSADATYLLPLAFFGFALCLLYARTGSLYPCIALHCVNNSLAFGVSQDWSWQIVPLLLGALALIAAGARVATAAWPKRVAPAT